jgi:uncharacterized protein with NAD-binding domain and iron-sulfur cluster
MCVYTECVHMTYYSAFSELSGISISVSQTQTYTTLLTFNHYPGTSNHYIVICEPSLVNPPCCYYTLYTLLLF